MVNDKADLVPAHLAVEAMRDNGYRNAAYAIAELIDNSIQAGATVVELLCQEDEELVSERVRRRLTSVSVLDNGSGMDADVLQLALQFGNGTHLADRSGIGRFGMGLPSASISQCSRLDVWSWKNGHANSIHTYIDLDEIRAGSQKYVPEPQPKNLPNDVIQRATKIADSGTLVRWTLLDRVMWKTAQTVIRNSEFVIARMYRRFLHDDLLQIRMATFTGNDTSALIDRNAVANDPGYLLAPSSTPEPFHEEAMFEPAGDGWETRTDVEFEGKTHEVVVRYSLARPEARPADVTNPGSTAYGKHAGRNIGISITRAGRELDLDQGLTIGYNPVERWWGVEIEFDPELDELFGVTNNKQSARNFTELASHLRTQRVTDKSWEETKLELHQDGDPTLPLVELIEKIDKNLRFIRKSLDVQRKGRTKTRHNQDASAEAAATRATVDRQQRGHSGQSDKDENLPSDEREEALARELTDSGVALNDARELAARTISSGVKYAFADADLEGMSFFTVKSVVGELLIKLNINHPAYRNLLEVLERPADDAVLSAEELRERLNRASRGLRLLLSAWARLEDEQPSDTLRAELQQIRSSWGAVAHRFMDEE